MKRPHRNPSDGMFHIKGNRYPELIGSRRQVWNGTAFKTEGGLHKSDLLLNKHQRIVSRKKHASAKREKRLQKAGYFTRKGHFGAIKKN